MNTLLLIRHGESEWNKEGKIQGQRNSELTELGVQQAHSIGVKLKSFLTNQPFRMFSSPLNRARTTASIIRSHLAEAPGCIELPELVIDDRLNDFNLGEVSGTRGWDEVARKDPELARARLEDPLRFHPPGGESGADFWARLEDFLSSLPEDDVMNLIVAHGVVNKFLRSIRRGIHGGDIIALGEGQDTIYQLVGKVETEITAGPLEQ